MKIIETVHVDSIKVYLSYVSESECPSTLGCNAGKLIIGVEVWEGHMSTLSWKEFNSPPGNFIAWLVFSVYF